MSSLKTPIKALAILISIGAAAIFAVVKMSTDDNLDNRRLREVERRDLVQRSTISGTVRPDKELIVTPPYNGHVRKIYVEIGEQVKKGDPLVSVSQSLDPRENVYPIRAPFSGRIVNLNKREGEYVEQNNKQDYILNLHKLDKLYVIASIPEMDILRVKKGMEAIISPTASDEKTYRGKIDQIALAPNESDAWRDQGKVEYAARIEILNPDEFLRSGMSVIIDIVTSKKSDVLVLPHEYVLKRDDQYFARHENGELIEIEVGIQSDTHSEITRGLKAGDRVQQIDFSDVLESKAK